MKRAGPLAMWALILLVIGLSILNFILIVEIRERNGTQASQHTAEISAIKGYFDGQLSRVKSSVEEIRVQKSEKAYTPVKGVDYFDGKDGTSVHIDDVRALVEETVRAEMLKIPIGRDGNDALTPMLRCNVLRNRWEIRYDITHNWQILDNTSVECTIKK